MKLLLRTFTFALILLGSVSFAGTHDLNATLAKASAEEKSDLTKLLQQISMVPSKDPQTGKSIFKVTKVEKGSFWEKQGYKVGDLVSQ